MATQIGQLKYSIGFDVKKQDLNSLKKQLQQLQKLSFSDFMKINNTDLDTAKKILNDVRTEANNVQKALNKAFNAKLSTYNIQIFKKELDGTSGSIQNVYNTLKLAGVTGQNAFRTMTNQVLNTNIQLKESHATLNQIATTLGNSIKWGASSAIINGITRSVQQAWGFVKSLDTSLNDIMIVTGKSADEMARFSTQATEAAKALGKTTVDYTKASLIYAQQGLNDQEIAARAAITLKAANVTGQSTDQVSEQLTSVWNGYKVTAEEAQIYVDRLAAVAANTASNLEQLSTGMSKVAAAAAAMGVGQDQLAAQLSTIISVTRQAPESVGTALRTVYARISDIKAGIDEDGVTLGNYSGKMAELGFNVLDVNGKLRDMGEVMEEIGGQWEYLTREQQVSLAQTMAGQRQYSNLIALFDNFKEYNRALNIAQNAAGTLQKQQDTYMQSTRAHLNQLKASTEQLYKSLINPDSFQPLIKALADAATLASKFIDSIGGGGNLLTSLGSIAFTVFSEQIAKGINTTITNLQVGKENAEQFAKVLQTTKQWKGIQGLDQFSTQLFENREQMLKLAQVMTPQQFSGMQSLLNTITQMGNEVAKLKEQKTFLDKTIESIVGMKDAWKSADDVMKSEQGRAQVIKRLQQQQQAIQSVILSIKQYGKIQAEINKKRFNGEDFSQELKEARENAEKYYEELEKLSNAGKLTTEHTEALKRIKEQMGTLDDSLDDQALIAKIQLIVGQLKGIAIRAGQVAAQTRQKVETELEGAVDSYADAIIEGQQKVNQGLAKFFANQEKFSKTLQIENFTKVAGGITQIGSAIKQIQNLGSIWKNSDLSGGEKLFQTVMNLAMSLPMLISGFTKTTTALGLLTVMTTKKAVADGISTAAEAAHAISIRLVGDESGKAAIKVQLLNATLMMNPFVAVAAAIVAATAALAAFIKSSEKARQQQIKLDQQIIQNEKKKQQQLQKNKDLYKSLEQLNEQYQTGQITKAQLKNQVGQLVNQYDLEQDAINNLIDSYDNLGQAIGNARKKNAQQQADSAKSAVQAQIDTIKKTYNYLNLGSSSEYNTGPKAIIEQLEELGYKTHKSRNSARGVSFIEYFLDLQNLNTAEQFTKFYQDLSTIKQKYNTDVFDNLLNQDLFKQLASLFQNALIKQAENVITKYDNNELKNIDNAQDYYLQRQKIMKRARASNPKEISTEQAYKYADQYIKEVYGKQYSQFNQYGLYLDKINNQFGKDNNFNKSILNLDSASLDFLQRNINLNKIGSQQGLQSIIDYLSKDNIVNRIQQLESGAASSLAVASEQFALYDSLADQIKNSKQKTIGKKEFESLDSEVQKYFTLMANGQYKMTADAEEFYNKINELSLEGFKENIEGLVGQQDRLNKIIADSKKDPEYLKNLINTVNNDLSTYFTEQDKNNYDKQVNAVNRAKQHNILLDEGSNALNINTALRGQTSIDANSPIFDILAQTGVSTSVITSWMAMLESSDLQAQKNALSEIQSQLDEIKNKGIDFQDFLKKSKTQLYQHLYAVLGSADSFKQLHNAYDQLIKDNPELENSTEILQAYNAALDDLNQKLDLQKLDSKELQTFAEYLQDAAQDSEDLSNSLSENADAAQIVAKSIMKMNDGFDALGKSWDDWLDVLNKSAVSSEQFANAMTGAKDALALLLDISKEYITNDFVLKHFDLISQAANGSADAVEKLRSELSESVIESIINQNSLQSIKDEILSEFELISSQMPNIQIGAELDDTNFKDRLQNLINICKLTTDQANALFDTWGFEPTFLMKEEDTEQTIPATEDAYQVRKPIEIDGVDSTGKPFTTSFPVVKHYTKDTTQTIKGKISIPALANGRTPQIDTIIKKAGSSFSNYSSKNAGGASSPKSTSKSKTSTSTKDTKDFQKDNRDIYHDINIQLAEINRQLSRTQKQQSKLSGAALITNLNKQNQILEKQKRKLKEKNVLQEKDLKQKREQLSLLGVTFDKYGHISNYLDILGVKQGNVNGLIAQRNSLVEQYNNQVNEDTRKMLDDQISALDKQIKTVETDYKDLETAIKNYDTLRTQMEDLVDQIQEETEKQVEIRINKAQMKVQISLDMGDFEREWNEYERKVRNRDDLFNDSDFDTLFKNAGKDFQDIWSYFDVFGESSLVQLTNGINDILAEDSIQEILNWDNVSKLDQSVYSDHVKQALDNLKSYSSQIIDQMGTIQDLKNNIDQAYFDTIDYINSEFDRQIEQYEFVNQRLQHDIDLVQLVYGEKAYDSMDAYYTQLLANDNKELDSLKLQAAYYKQMWDNAIGEQDAKKFEELWRETMSQLDSKLAESIQTAQDQYINAINKIYDQLDKRLTSGKGLEYVQMEWQLINKNVDEYLDTINSAFALRDLESKFQKAINDTKNVKNQKTLTDLMNQQLDHLRTKDKLTQYDVERAEKLLGIEQARMALEDTRNAKTSLRLKRDSQGNYSYVYTASEKDVDDAEDKLAKLQNDLYNFDKQAYRDNLDDMLSAYKEYLSKQQDILIKYKDDEEARERALTLLRQQYGEYINGKTQENIQIRTNLANSAAEDYIALYNENSLNFKQSLDTDYQNFEQLTQSMKEELASQFVPNWQNSVQQMTKTFIGQGGFTSACKAAWQEVDAKTVEYQTTVHTLADSAGKDLDQLKTGIDKVKDAYSELITQNDALIKKMDQQMDKINTLRKQLDLLQDKYKDVWSAADLAAQKAYDAWMQWQKYTQDVLNTPTPNPTVDYNPPTTLPTMPTVSTTNSSFDNEDKSLIGGNLDKITNKNIITAHPDETVLTPYQDETLTQGLAGAIYHQLWGPISENSDSQSWRTIKQSIVNLARARDLDVSSSQAMAAIVQARRFLKQGSSPGRSLEYYEKYYSPQSWLPKLKKYDTGGYTGEWGPSGRLAMLHQKQLVLNATDTKNILNSVAIIRDMVTGLSGNIFSRLNGLSGGYSRSITSQIGGQVDQNVTISASFPNVNSKKEIEDAFTELVNLAAQRAMKR